MIARGNLQHCTTHKKKREEQDFMSGQAIIWALGCVDLVPNGERKHGYGNHATYSRTFHLSLSLKELGGGDGWLDRNEPRTNTTSPSANRHSHSASSAIFHATHTRTHNWRRERANLKFWSCAPFCASVSLRSFATAVQFDAVASAAMKVIIIGARWDTNHFCLAPLMRCGVPAPVAGFAQHAVSGLELEICTLGWVQLVHVD